MITLFKNIENYKEVEDLRDLLVVAWNFDLFVPPEKAKAYADEVEPLYKELVYLSKNYFGVFDSERKKLSSVIEKYYDQNYFNKQKENLKNNMFDVNYLLKGYLEKMNKEQLIGFGTVVGYWYVALRLFMTHWNWIELTDEIRTKSSNGSDNLPLSFQGLSEDELRQIFLKHIDLNVILADNLAEAILNGIGIEDAMKYVDSVLTMRENNRYRLRILM